MEMLSNFGLGLATFSEKDPKGGPSNTMHALGGDLYVRKATLEDVFLRLTSRNVEAAA